MINSTQKLILASQSKIRLQLLMNAGVEVIAMPARIDEESIREAMILDGAPPRDIADALAEGKARKLSMKHPEAMVIGCDQVLAFKGRLISKADTKDDARATLAELRGQRHRLLSAAVIYEGGEPKWRHIGEVRLEMKQVSDTYLDDYLTRNWESVREAVGCYKLEEEGVRLFSRIDGEYFNVLGLPLLQILTYLGDREVIQI